MTTKQLVKELISKGKGRKEIVKIVMKQTGASRDHIQRCFKSFVPKDYRTERWEKLSKSKLKKKPHFIKKSNPVKDIMHPDEFIGGIDIVKQVMEFLNTEVKDGYIEDEKLRRRFEISIGKWKEIKSLPVFEGRIFIYAKPTGQKAAVWSSKRGVKMARETISMARYEL